MLHKLRLRAVLALLVTLILAPQPGPHAVRAASPQQQLDALEPAACMFDVPADRVEGQDLICGYLRVPERHADPEGNTIRLAVVIIKSKDPAPAPDPLVMLQGGPGGSTIDTYTQLLFSPTSPGLNRDVILFDQRGTLYSEPSLLCDELFRLTDETIEQRLTNEEGERLSLDATKQCRERLADEGVVLDAYTSLENAADVEALRVALGYDQINLYGVSYGSLLAQHVMRNHPQGLRSVILDAVVPTRTNALTQSGRTIDRALSELFAACAADSDCNAAYPDLERVLFETIDRLNQEPALIALTDRDTGRTYERAVLDGDSFFSIIFQLLYASDFLPALPAVIYDASQGDFSVLAQTALPLIVFDRTLSLGMYYSVNCAEDADFQLQDIPTAGLRPKVAEDTIDSGESFLKVCDFWQTPPLGPEVDAPVTSAIPTLLLSGRFDPVTPQPFAEEVASGLSRSVSFVFGYVGHGAFLTGSCPDKIVQSFLDNPELAPDGGCIAEKPAPRFISPATTLMSKAPLQILRSLEPENLWQPALLALTLLTLLSAWLVYPLAWLIARLGNRARRPGSSLARWLAVLAGLVGLVFVISLGSEVFGLIFANDLTIFYGLPRDAAWLFWLPLLSLALTAGMVLYTLLAWARGYWSVLGRLYYTLLMLAGVGFVAVLGVWDALSALV